MEASNNDELWTPEKQQQLVNACESLLPAIKQYVNEIVNATPSDDPQFETERDLFMAIEKFIDAQYEYSATLPPFILPLGDQAWDGVVEAEEVAYPSDDEEAPSFVSVLCRADYRVVDKAKLLEDGRKAFLTNHPDADDTQAWTDVTHIGRAIYQVEHLGGLLALENLESLRFAGSAKWVVAVDEVLEDFPQGEQFDEPFSIADSSSDDVLHRALDL